MEDNKCIFCEEIIPEGIQICPNCWEELMGGNKDENNKIS